MLQKQPARIKINQTPFHSRVGVLFILPGKSYNQGWNHQPPTLSYLLHPNAKWSSLLKKPSMAHKTRLVSCKSTKVSLQLFLTNETATRKFHLITTPPHHKSHEHFKRSFFHTWTSPPSSLTITFGPQVQPSHVVIETQPKNCWLERILMPVISGELISTWLKKIWGDGPLVVNGNKHGAGRKLN